MTAPPMSTCRIALIRSLVLTPLAMLAGCGRGDGPPAPLDPAALAVVVARPGAPRERLARAIDGLFADSGAGETRALVIEVDGWIVAERYGPGFDKTTPQLGWGMSDTVTGLMIGLLVADGRLRLDESVPVPAWQRSGDPRGEITLRQLLQMRSGLRNLETASPAFAADPARMLFLDGRDDMAGYAEAQPLAAEPGRQFAYSSATGVILADLAARVLTDRPDPDLRRQVVGDYLRTRLLEPVRLRSMVPEFDAAGTLIGSTMIHATARDWARLGEFLRNGGAVKGAQILPHGWVEFMTAPSPANQAYGAQVWLNRRGGDGAAPLLAGDLPAGVFAATGQPGQYLVVSPRQHVTLVRLGRGSADQDKAVASHLAEILRLFPER